jgi:murein L,D-transpeptidase YcbB/YkuD
MIHDRARKYNLSRALDAPTYARLSAAVGRDVSGWTDADLDAVAAWQRAQGLTPDGMVGPRTVAALPVVWISVRVLPGIGCSGA